MRLIKAKRTFSRTHTTLNVALAWSAVGYAMYLGAAMASAVVPLMVILIASLLGIYQGVGHFDMRAQLQAGAAPSPQPVEPDADPPEERQP